MMMIMQTVSVARAAPSPFAARYGPWAVVTGASDGIGRAFAVELAVRGLDLVVVARRQDLLDTLAAQLRRDHGVSVVVVAADLGVGVDAVATAVADKDVGLVVCAAGFGTSGAFADSDLAAELAMIDVNCGAVCALTRLVVPRLRERKRGGIVLLSSLLAFQGVPRAANYAATKAWVQTFAEGLSGELAPFDVDVVASAPGPIQSGFADRAAMVMGRAGTPEEVATGTLDALRGGGTVRPGALSKLLEASLAFLPRRGRARVLAKVMGGMTQHHA